MDEVPRFGVFVSGSGTLLEAMLAAGLPIRLVIADRKCRGIEIAKRHRRQWNLDDRMEIIVIDRRNYGYGTSENWDRKRFTTEISVQLQRFDIDVVAMAGFMTILDPIIFERFNGWVLNIHPSLLPAFRGEHAVRDALTAGVTKTGTTIHIATELLDDDTYIIEQREVPIKPDDTEETLHERIKMVERELYVLVLFRILNGTIRLQTIRPLKRR